MAKKSAAEIKKEAARLKEIMANAKKKPHNFALLIGKDGLVFEADIRKPPAAMRRLAKANGGGAKGASGVMTVSGKLIQFQCDDDNVPRALTKLARKHFSERGFAYKFEISLPGGESLDGGDSDEEAAPENEGARPAKEGATQETEGARPAKEGATQETEGARPAKEGATQETEGARPAKEGATQEESEEGAAPAKEGGGAKAEEKQEQKEAAAREGLVKAFKAMGPAIQKALALDDKNANKKINFLVEAFTTEVEGPDLKRAASILSLLRKTIAEAEARAAKQAQAAAADEAAAESDEAKAADATGDEAAAEAGATLTPKRREEMIADLGKMEAELDDLMAELV